MTESVKKEKGTREASKPSNQSAKSIKSIKSTKSQLAKLIQRILPSAEEKAASSNMDRATNSKALSEVIDNSSLDEALREAGPARFEAATPTENEQLLLLFKRETYRANGRIPQEDLNHVVNRIRAYITIDTPDVIVLHNEDGRLCYTYPPLLFIPRPKTGPMSRITGEKLDELICQGKFSRCRTRFPAPSFMVQDRYVCRSASLRCKKEDIFSNDSHVPVKLVNSSCNLAINAVAHGIKDDPWRSKKSMNADPTQAARRADSGLLRYLGVSIIGDLMVNEIHCYNMEVCASEQIERETNYKDFGLLGVPFPGSEFFSEFHDNDFEAKGLVYGWNDPWNTMMFSHLPHISLKPLGIEWSEYQKWDLIKLCQNLTKLFLFYLKGQPHNSLLVHCISGWDRTPLWASLLRLTLWADGLVNPSLGENEIIFLAVGYDWYLFGHELRHRIEQNQVVLYFTFYFLQHIESDEYAYQNIGTTDMPYSSNGARQERLRKCRIAFAKAYHNTCERLPPSHLK